MRTRQMFNVAATNYCEDCFTRIWPRPEQRVTRPNDPIYSWPREEVAACPEDLCCDFCGYNATRLANLHIEDQLAALLLEPLIPALCTRQSVELIGIHESVSANGIRCIRLNFGAFTLAGTVGEVLNALEDYS